MRTKSTFRSAPWRGTCLGLIALGLSTGAARAQTAYGLLTASATDQRLVTFEVTAPGTFTAATPITGLGPGQTLVGLDSRPNTGEVFALGYNQATTQAQLYTVNMGSGALTTVGSALTLNLGTNAASPGDVRRVGFDFNPTVDRIRVTGANNSNFRLNPTTGALAATDTNLTYAAADANAAQTPGIGAVAYTNSYIGATATTLYDIDETYVRLTTQSPPNMGALNTVGPLGISSNVLVDSDLDIYFNPATGANQAYLSGATATPFNGTNQLYTLNLTTGTTTLVGAVGPTGASAIPLTDIALRIVRTAPGAVTGNLVYGLAGTNLLTFDTALPGTIRTSVGLTGVPADQVVVGLDIRPATNVLYGLGYRATDQMAQLYTVNATNGSAIAVGSPVMLALGTGAVGFDFNPTVDRIRVVGANRANYRLNPLDGTIAATDTPLAYAAGDANAAATPAVVTVAYTNSFMGASSTSGTTLYDYDAGLNVLTTQLPPNDGKLNTIGSSGLTLNTIPNVSLDIYSATAGTNTAYLVANSAASVNSSLYTVNLTTGATTLVGAVGNGLTVRDIAVANATGVVTTVRDRADLATGLSVFPNPTRGRAKLTFTLAHSGRVMLTVFDAVGRRVTTQTSALLPAGPQFLQWEAANAKPGLYLLRLTVDGQPAATRQLVVE